MSAPRPIFPGATYLVTRRCTQRTFLLRPSASVNQVFLYCLAIAAGKTGVIVHAVTVMSNHHHLVVTDPLGQLPVFCAWLHEFVAKALNAHYGRWENFWASESTSVVRLVEDEDVLDKVVYTLANPVAAGLVERGEQWPGVRLYTPGRRTIKRPEHFFRANGPLPEEAELDLVLPPIGAATQQAALALIKDAVAAREAEHRQELAAADRAFLGPAGVLAQDPTDRPRSREPRRGLSPRVACRSTWHRVEILRRCREFLLEYAEAFRRWRANQREVVFPHGTYLMARQHGALVAPAPA